MTDQSAGDTVYCRECGAEILRAAEICPDCGVRQRSPPSSRALEHLLDGRNPLIAALLSAVFPGLGHVYVREIDTGLFFAVAFVIAIFTLLIGIGFVLVPGIWLYALYDAAKTAERRDDAFAETAAASPP